MQLYNTICTQTAMNQHFEFDSPTHCNLLKKRKLKQGSNYSIDPNDPNDQWFTYAHPQLDKAFALNEEPIKRETIRTQPIEKIEPKKEITKKASKPVLKSKVDPPKFEKSKSLNVKVQDKKREPKKQLEHSRDNRPCPFAYRVQRAWERDHEKKWHSLSAKSKRVAEEQMKKYVNK